MKNQSKEAKEGSKLGIKGRNGKKEGMMEGRKEERKEGKEGRIEKRKGRENRK